MSSINQKYPFLGSELPLPQVTPHLAWIPYVKIAKEDAEYQQLQQLILNGFPNHCSQLPDSCKQYWTAHDHHTIDDDLIVHRCRLLIPISMRS